MDNKLIYLLPGYMKRAAIDKEVPAAVSNPYSTTPSTREDMWRYGTREPADFIRDPGGPTRPAFDPDAPSNWFNQLLTAFIPQARGRTHQWSPYVGISPDSTLGISPRTPQRSGIEDIMSRGGQAPQAGGLPPEVITYLQQWIHPEQRT